MGENERPLEVMEAWSHGRERLILRTMPREGRKEGEEEDEGRHFLFSLIGDSMSSDMTENMQTLSDSSCRDDRHNISSSSYCNSFLSSPTSSTSSCSYSSSRTSLISSSITPSCSSSSSMSS